MSFDPQNPRGAPRPTPPPSSSPTPVPAAPTYLPPQPNQVPPQPQRSGLSPLLIAAVAVIAIGVLGFGALILTNLNNKPITPAPTSSVRPTTHSSTAPTTGTTPPASAIQPSSATSAPPTSTASGLPTTGPSGAIPGGTLLTHIPEAIRATCTTAPGTEDILFTADCTNGDGTITVTYVEYSSAASMNTAYLEAVGRSQIEADTGSCEDHATWPAESSYDVNDEPAGRRLCTDNPGSPTIVWTDDQLAIISQAASPGGDAAGLIEFWTSEAGPIP